MIYHWIIFGINEINILDIDSKPSLLTGLPSVGFVLLNHCQIAG